MNLLRRIFTRKPAGDIAANGLNKWWIEELSQRDRNAVLSQYGADQLLSGRSFPHPGGAPAFLANLATWLPVAEAPLVFRIVVKADTMPRHHIDPDRHYFLLHNLIEGYYRCIKTIPEAKAACEAVCRDQIQLYPKVARMLTEPDQPPILPIAYTRLSMIYQRDRNVPECAKVCADALAAGGGQIFETRLARCRKAAGH